MIILTIARHSFREVFRKRILLVTLLFAVALVATSPLWPAMSDEDRVKLIEDISLSAMTFFGIILTVFIAAYSLPSDIDEKRIFTLVTKPVRRHHLIIGKLLGFMLVFAVIIGVMALLSGFLIRKMSTYDRLQITSPEAPLYLDNNEVGSVAKGVYLRVLESSDGFHTVLLPDDLIIDEAWVNQDAVEFDKTANRVETILPEVALYSRQEGGFPMLKVPAGTMMSVREAEPGGYLVALPEELRIRRAQVKSTDASEPRLRMINAKRVVEPVSTRLENRGHVQHTSERIILSTMESQIGESWIFESIDAGKLPEGDMIPVHFRVGGIEYTDTDDQHVHSESCQHLNALGEITRFDAIVRAADLSTGVALPAISTDAIWGDGFYDMRLELPRKLLEGGRIRLTIESSKPSFSYRRTTFLGGERKASWRFRKMNMRRFSADDRVRGAMQFELYYQNMPAHGSDVANVQFKVSPPSGERSEIITVPIRRGRNIEFDFDRSLIDTDGNVEISIHRIPDEFILGAHYNKPAILLMQQPVPFEYSYLKTVTLIYCQLVLVGSVTVAASTFLSGGVAALLGFFFYFAGMLVGFMRDVLKTGPQFLAGHHHGITGEQIAEHARSFTWRYMEIFINTLIRLVPDINKFDAREFLLSGLDVPGMMVLDGIGVTVIYAIAAMLIAWLIFRRRQLS